MPNLEDFTIDDLAASADLIAFAARGAASMEEAAQRICTSLHESMCRNDGAPATALVRLYKTHRFGELQPEQQLAAIGAAGDDLDSDTRCLTLLGSAGALQEWNDRRRSAGHRAIPLKSAAAVERIPMVAQLIRDMGLEVESVIEPDPALNIERHHRDYEIFHVPHALGSPAVPAQDFVRDFGIRSVVGFGGVLPSGDLFALILFSTVPVLAEAADLLRSLSLSVKAAIVKHTYKVFAPVRA